MSIETITRRGKEFVLVERTEYDRLCRRDDADSPPLPPRNREGLREAVPFARALIARSIIRDRQALGWSQAELARRSGTQAATLNRIEKGHVTPDQATLAKLDRALKRHGRKKDVI